MNNWENPQHEDNGEQHHTGKPCVEDGCNKPAGTAWGPYWCQAHNAERLNRISGNLEKITNTKPKPRSKAQIKSELKAKSDELARVGNLKFDASETIAKGHVQTLRNEVNDLQDELDQLDAKDDGQHTVTPSTAHFGGMCWPRVNDKNSDLSWRLRYAQDQITDTDKMWASSIINAYLALIGGTNEKRNFIANKLKTIESLEEKAAEVMQDMATNPTLEEQQGLEM